MHQHVPSASLGSPGLPLSSYDQLGPRGRRDKPWPPEPPPRPGPRNRRGLLRRVAGLPRLAAGTH